MGVSFSDQGGELQRITFQNEKQQEGILVDYYGLITNSPHIIVIKSEHPWVGKC